MDARVQRIYAGTNEIMKTIIAEQIDLRFSTAAAENSARARTAAWRSIRWIDRPLPIRSSCPEPM